MAKKTEPREPLSADRIETAALDLIEKEGLDAFSTRKLAATLSCEAMSIYHYFPSKGHLMDALVDRVIGNELTVLSPAAGPWRKQMEAAHDFLLRVRTELHYQAPRPTDALLKSMQPTVAYELGYHERSVSRRKAMRASQSRR